MKKVLAALIISGTYQTSIAQTLQASIGQGDIPSKVTIYVKSSGAVATTNISTLQFDLAINDAITPKPTVVVIPNTVNFPGVTWQVSNTTEGGFYHFALTTPTAPIQVTSLNTTNEVAVMDVEFKGGPVGANNVALVTLPGGGTTNGGNQLFYCTGTPSSVGTNLYYTRAGTTANNGDSYDGVATSTAIIGGISLPVKFLSFYAIKNGDDAKLTWTVESDNNNKYFEIERSFDGRSFTMLSKVDAKGNGNTVNTYESADSRLSALRSAAVYYRVKQVDKNGEISYSNIRNLNTSANGVPASLYPNPVKNTTRLVVDAVQPGKASIVIRDYSGNMVKQLNTQFVKGLNQFDIKVPELASGEYSILVAGEGYNYTLRMTKVN